MGHGHFGRWVLLPPVPTVLGTVLGVVVFFAILVALGRPRTAVILVAVVGGLALLGNFSPAVDRLGLVLALVVYLSAAAALMLLVWALNRYVVPLVNRYGE
jgi:hypothetical protein